MELDTFFEVVRITLRVLSERILHLMTTILSAFMFGWVMYNPDWLRLCGAVAFTCLMLILTYIGGKHAARDTGG